jgi:hypothetical protein
MFDANLHDDINIRFITNHPHPLIVSHHTLIDPDIHRIPIKNCQPHKSLVIKEPLTPAPQQQD